MATGMGFEGAVKVCFDLGRTLFQCSGFRPGTVFLSVYGAQESIPPSRESIPGLLKGTVYKCGLRAYCFFFSYCLVSGHSDP
jgi:hypothetical protein